MYTYQKHKSDETIILTAFYENVKLNKYWMIDLVCSRIILRQDELVQKIQSIKRILPHFNLLKLGRLWKIVSY